MCVCVYIYIEGEGRCGKKGDGGRSVDSSFDFVFKAQNLLLQIDLSVRVCQSKELTRLASTAVVNSKYIFLHITNLTTH